MADDSVDAAVGKILLGGAVGFALFFIVTGRGLGRVGRESHGEETFHLPRPKDDKRLTFVMIEPTAVGRPMGFRSRDGEALKIYSLKELIARVKDGKRTDVELRASGAVIQGAWNEARQLIEHAGLTVWLAEASPVSVGFPWRDDTRGQYRRRFK